MTDLSEQELQELYEWKKHLYMAHYKQFQILHAYTNVVSMHLRIVHAQNTKVRKCAIIVDIA